MIKNRLLLLLLILIPLSASAMDPAEYKSKPTDTEEQPYFTSIPDEIKLHILSFLDNAKTIKDAIKNIKAIALVNRSFNNLLTDQSLTNLLINKLVVRFPEETLSSPIVAAVLLNTPGSKIWLRTRGKEVKEFMLSRLQRLKKKNMVMKDISTDISAQVMNAILDVPEIAAYFAKEYRIFDESMLYNLILHAHFTQDGHINIIKKLIDAGADLDFQSPNSSLDTKTKSTTPLMIVVKKLSELQNILSSRLSKDKKEKAAINKLNYDTILDLLLKGKANTNLKDDIGKTALNYALDDQLLFNLSYHKSSPKQKIMRLKLAWLISQKLIEAGAIPNAHDNNVLGTLKDTLNEENLNTD